MLKQISRLTDTWKDRQTESDVCVPAADVVQEQGHGAQAAVQLGVVVEAALPLQLHRLAEEGLQPPRGQHHGGRQVRYRQGEGEIGEEGLRTH